MTAAEPLTLADTLGIKRKLNGPEVLAIIREHFAANGRHNNGNRALGRVVLDTEANLCNIAAHRRRVSDDTVIRWAVRVDLVLPWPDLFPLRLARLAAGLTVADVGAAIRADMEAGGWPAPPGAYSAKFIRRRENLGGWSHSEMCAYLRAVQAPALCWEVYASPFNAKPRAPRRGDV